jgi:hypothetical protein
MTNNLFGRTHRERPEEVDVGRPGTTGQSAIVEIEAASLGSGVSGSYFIVKTGVSVLLSYFKKRTLALHRSMSL